MKIINRHSETSYLYMTLDMQRIKSGSHLNNLGFFTPKEIIEDMNLGVV